ncbi:MAG: GntR family transcriptional regulator [Defluviitaleaceae bacterium]|nr:GntR family transcriptional regulator [Defluviitaleaceae bacterium]
MLLELQPYSEKPIYEQLMLEIKRGIVTGELVPGEALPSVRMLATDIGINMHTVNKVYKQLQQAKVLVKKKNGFIVNPEPLKPTEDAMTGISERIYELMIEKALYGITDDEVLFLMKNVNLTRKEH